MNPWWILWAAVPVALVWQVRRTLGQPLDCDRIIAEALASTEPLIGTADEAEPVYDGPDQLQLLEDTERYINQLTANDPELAAGFDRLRRAIREHREEDS